MSDADKFDIESGDDFDSDDSEIQRELEERMRAAEEEGKEKIFDDVSDAQSVMSMGNTMSNMNFIPVDTDLDNLIDQMLLNQNPAHLAELERQRQERLEHVKREQAEDEALIYTEENKQNMEDMKQLNQIKFAQI